MELADPLPDMARTQQGLIMPSVRYSSWPHGAKGPWGAPPWSARGGSRHIDAWRRGNSIRLEVRPLALTAEELELLESMSPLLGPTPRRVKRFVNTCQLLLAMRNG